MWPFLVLLSIAPGMAIAIFIYWKDKFEKEPRHLLVKSFFLGVFSCIPAVILSRLGEKIGRAHV